MLPKCMEIVRRCNRTPLGAATLNFVHNFVIQNKFRSKLAQLFATKRLKFIRNLVNSVGNERMFGCGLMVHS